MLVGFFNGGISAPIDKGAARKMQSGGCAVGGHVLCLECRGRTVLDVRGVGGLEVNAFLAAAADRLAQKMTVCGRPVNTSRLIFSLISHTLVYVSRL